MRLGSIIVDSRVANYAVSKSDCSTILKITGASQTRVSTASRKNIKNRDSGYFR